MLNLLSVFVITLFASLFVEAACPSSQYQVKGHFRSGYTRSDGSVVKATTVKTHCKQLSKGYQYLQSRFAEGVPIGWPHKTEKVRNWTEAEKQRLIEIIEELPDSLLSRAFKNIYRLQKSKDFPNPATSADGVIVVYDSSFDPARDLGRILAHELSHQSFLELSEEDQQDYRRATGWTVQFERDQKLYWIPRKDGYVEDDGRISYGEDYANNLEYFLYDPDKLKKVTPSAYKWFEKRFGKGFKLKREKK
ncbi:MAG: hypothetical protein AB7H97_22660 [Pseudobdellovibrionaceae bacterium]